MVQAIVPSCMFATGSRDKLQHLERLLPLQGGGVAPKMLTHWTGRAMATAIGISVGSVQRIWRVHKLQPHRLRTFKRRAIRALLPS